MRSDAAPLTLRALPGDLAGMVELYLHLNPSMPILPQAHARSIWSEILSRQGVEVFVRALDSRLVATCTLVTVPNLMRGGTPYAFIENVVTHGDFRRQGHGQAVLSAALAAAWDQGCRNVALLTARKDPAVRPFYESCGFETGIKTGFLAVRPSGA